MSAERASCAEDPLERVYVALGALDHRVDRAPGAGLSLDPRKPGRRATRMQALWMSSEDASPQERVVLGDALGRVGESVLEAFPLNLFWDLDGVFAELRRASRISLDHTAQLAAALADLMTLFGCDSPIRFQYVHDFVYGFDWAEWVRREPSTRAAVGPPEARYVARTRQRGVELLALIQADDAKYPKVTAGEFRNPFSFTRTADEERKLFQALAAADAIPNPAWCQVSPPCWDRDFDAMREAVAARLGLLRDR